MSTLQNLVAGVGGAVALNILHESLKRTNPDMPRIDLLGEEALQRGLNYFGKEITNENRLYSATLAADLVSNSVYYALIGGGRSKNLWPRAIVLGMAAGIGAVALPKPMGLNPEPVTRTQKVKALTVAYYMFGALVTAGILELSSKKQR
jgi:hypothetical protein